MVKPFCRSFVPVAVLTALVPALVAAEDVGPECRGVAAGVVAAMRAAGELPNEQTTAAAVVAARRACSAARRDLGVATTVDPATPATPEAAADGAGVSKEDISLWDLLTGDVERKPGNERLRRLKQ